MKKVFISIFGLVALTGCYSHYDYYKGNVKYVQEGTDCVYYAGERGRRFSDEIRYMGKDQKVVYRNTLCANLLDKDTAGQAYVQNRRVLASVAAEAPSASCGCKTGCAQTASVLKRRYVIVSNM
jgi:hypothetical protein